MTRSLAPNSRCSRRSPPFRPRTAGRRRGRWLARLATALLLLPACTSFRARRAFDAGDYLESAQLYGEAYRRFGREQIRERRDEARTRAVEVCVAEVERLRRHGVDRVARDRLERLLERARGWGRPFAETEQSAIDELVAWAARGDHQESRRLLDQGHPLDARRILPARPGMLGQPAYARARRNTVEAIDAAGAERCHELQASPSASPRLRDLTASYCREFEAAIEPHERTVAACHRAEVTVDGQLAEDERAGLAREVQRLLANTPYLHPRGHCVLDVHVTASRVLDTTRTPTTEVATWTVQVPYTDRVLRTEYYTDYERRTQTRYVRESYTVSVPTSSTCGYGDHTYTCSRSRTETRYRSVPKTEWTTVPVRKSRQVWKTVTRYRTEGRSHRLGEVSLTGAGRPHHEQVMSAGGGDFERTLRAFLSFDVFQVERVLGELTDLRRRPRKHLCATHMIDKLQERARRNDVHFGRSPGSLRATSRGTNQPLIALVGCDRRRQHTGNRRE